MDETKRDNVTMYYMANGKHDRQLRRLTSKPIAKWSAKDFGAIEMTRTGRDAALAALTTPEKERHAGLRIQRAPVAEVTP